MIKIESKKIIPVLFVVIFVFISKIGVATSIALNKSNSSELVRLGIKTSMLNMLIYTILAIFFFIIIFKLIKFKKKKSQQLEVVL